MYLPSNCQYPDTAPHPPTLLKSGMGVQEWFYLPLGEAATSTEMATTKVGAALFEKVGAQPGTVEKLILLGDHPDWRLFEQVGSQDTISRLGDNGEVPQSTFDMGLTEDGKG